MTRILAIATHPDDETLGCGGILLRHRAEGNEIHWVIVTRMDPTDFPTERIAQREAEIAAVAKAYGFAGVHVLGFPAASLDAIPQAKLISVLADVVRMVKPNMVLTPFPGDAHGDHRAVFEAVAPCTKTFRHPSVETVLAYETLSETDFALDPTTPAFRPNLFVEIGPFLERKIDIMRLYVGELGEHPFPRSVEAIRAAATLRGAQANCQAAEAFMVLKDVRRLKLRTNA